jgi:hypothetical protein
VDVGSAQGLVLVVGEAEPGLPAPCWAQAATSVIGSSMSALHVRRSVVFSMTFSFVERALGRTTRDLAALPVIGHV